MRWVSQFQACKRVIKATHVSRRILCRILKKGVTVKQVVTMPFSTPNKLTPKQCTKFVLGSNETVLMGTVHNCCLTKHDSPTLKATNTKIRESTSYEGGASSLKKILRRMGFSYV
jgi:hypothetical protein